MGAGIYCITNKINNKRYIGQSKYVERRFKEHKRRLRGGYHKNNHLQKSFNVYGEKNFEFAILEECEPEQLDDLEIYYIKKYDTFKNKEKGYNLDSGGNPNKTVREETRIKQSEAHKGKRLSEETKKKVSIGTSKATNSTGFFRVTKRKDANCLKGFKYVYRYQLDGKRKEINNVDVLKLKERVIKKGLEWEILDENKAQATLME